jgi:hypothetical protein
MAYKDLMFAKEPALRQTALSTSELDGDYLKLCNSPALIYFNFLFGLSEKKTSFNAGGPLR